MAWYRRWPFVSGVALVVITNAVVLAGVIYNRSGDPGSTLTLTQRELAVPYSYWQADENTGLALRVSWRVEPPEDQRSRHVRYGGEPAWLDAAKIEELGIRVRARAPRNAADPAYSHSLPVDVLMVLEMNGPAYRRLLERACKRATDSTAAKDHCAQEKNSASRLFIVDAGLAFDTLRRKYPNTATHAIVHGQIEATRVSDPFAPTLFGHIRGIAVDEIQVPVPLRAPIEPDRLLRWNARQEKPFEATVAFGRRLEPWIVSLSSPPIARASSDAHRRTQR
jgi:hypothetical protein